MNPAVKLEELYKIYSSGEVKVQALSGLNLEINDGEFVGLAV